MLEVEIGTIHLKDRPQFRNDDIQCVDIVQLAVENISEIREIPIQVHRTPRPPPINTYLSTLLHNEEATPFIRVRSGRPVFGPFIFHPVSLMREIMRCPWCGNPPESSIHCHEWTIGGGRIV